VSQAPRYGLSPDQFAQELVQSGQVSSAVSEVRRSKALAHVLEHAKIVDSRGDVIDLSAISGEDLVALDEDHSEYGDSEYGEAIRHAHEEADEDDDDEDESASVVTDQE
jgi:trigger factor